MTPTITVFMGVIGSGKDHNANLTGHQRIDFKDALVEMCSDIVGYDISKNYDWFKEFPVGVMRPSNPLAEAMLRSEWAEIMRKHPEIVTGRKLLTRVGTEAIRKRHPNYWVDAMVKRADAALGQNLSVVTADCRFFNEVEALLHRELAPAKFVFCNYKSGRYNPRFDHASEKLAQTLLGLGFEDGREIFISDFVIASKTMGEKFLHHSTEK